MIGQRELLEKLNSYTLSSLPHSILLEGERGCGKHTLFSLLVTKFSVDTEVITEKLDYEYISTLFTRVSPFFCLVDGVPTERAQNALLKFLEEPPALCYVFILCENRNEYLETVQNRCTHFKFQPYSKDELKQFTTDESVLEYATTPGQIIEFSKIDMTEMISLCDTILQKISGASIPNTLTLSSKFNFGKDPTKFSIELFCRLLLKKSFSYVLADENYARAYFIISELCSKLNIPSIDKKKLFESKLLDLKFALK